MLWLFLITFHTVFLLLVLIMMSGHYQTKILEQFFLSFWVLVLSFIFVFYSPALEFSVSNNVKIHATELFHFFLCSDLTRKLLAFGSLT